jgi:hypothetical protein
MRKLAAPPGKTFGRYGSPNCRKEEEIEQLKGEGWDAQSDHPTSGNAESAIPPDKVTEQKENAPEDTSAFSEFANTGLPITSTGFDTAVYEVEQARNAIRSVIQCDMKFCTNEWVVLDLEPIDLKFATETLEAGCKIYSQCFRTDTQQAFERIFFTSFEDYEICLQRLGRTLGSPVTPWSRRS